MTAILYPYQRHPQPATSNQQPRSSDGQGEGMRAERISLSKAIEREPLPQFYQRVRNGGARKPLRSLRELAEEFGVPHKTLQAKLARCKGAPKPIYSTGSQQRNTWYDPDEVRAWWAALTKEGRND